ncbi:hypothetical protein BKA64DRAFT_687409 [Cadophora sp. MPI-SDFR-AT-0126]|nr:hypothetical protein BKA64DRAFT_687409 [Leotiomycetes sp. MPI-SDFR-AT-0126]
MIWSKTWSRLIGQPSMCDSQPSLAVYEGQAVGRWIDTSGGVKHWYGVGKLNVVSSLGRCLSGNVQQTEKWTVEFMTTTFFEPVRPAYDSATGRVHLNFSLQPAEQVHIVLLVDVSGFSTHIQVTKLGPMANPGPRPYTRLSSSQNKALMDHCIDEPYPNHSTAFNLSQRLDIPREQTMKWFQRARAQNRQRTPMHLLNETGGAHPVKKQTASTELRSPYMLRSKSKKVRWAQNPPEMESVTVSASIDAVIEKAWDGEDTIIADHPGSTMGMTLVKENSRVVRRSARVGGV